MGRYAKHIYLKYYYFTRNTCFCLDFTRITCYDIITEREKEENDMKEYNLSKIMKRAWELVKKARMTISSGQKKAWEEAKAVKEKFEDI